jgi:undecaprenyl pyrophosphate synthase
MAKIGMKGKKAGKGGGRGEMLVVTSKVKAYTKGLKLKCAGDLAEALNGKVQCLLEGAAERTRANKRGTLRPQDL